MAAGHAVAVGDLALELVSVHVAATEARIVGDLDAGKSGEMQWSWRVSFGGDVAQDRSRSGDPELANWKGMKT
jgi:hypothetical protein